MTDKEAMDKIQEATSAFKENSDASRPRLFPYEVALEANMALLCGEVRRILKLTGREG